MTETDPRERDLSLSDLRPEALWKAEHIRKPTDLLGLVGECHTARADARDESFPKDPAEAARAAQKALNPDLTITVQEPETVLRHTHALLRALLAFAEDGNAIQSEFQAGIWLLDDIGSPALDAVSRGMDDASARLSALKHAARHPEPRKSS
ncbi:MAG: hypothetical protein JJU42_08145 [Rhodobacteraceae bacterium]|nr:hypothetical protein [Paracoccaceae bacterium]